MGCLLCQGDKNVLEYLFFSKNRLLSDVKCRLQPTSTMTIEIIKPYYNENDILSLEESKQNAFVTSNFFSTFALDVLVERYLRPLNYTARMTLLQ